MGNAAVNRFVRFPVLCPWRSSCMHKWVAIPLSIDGCGGPGCVCRSCPGLHLQTGEARWGNFSTLALYY